MLKFFVITITLFICNYLSAQSSMNSLVSTEWLSKHLNDPDLIVLDCTFLVKFDENGMMFSESGKKTYDLEHIPNAGFADLLGELSDQESEFDFTMLPPQKFANAMAALGVDSHSKIVLYSQTDPLSAARVWWMLRWIGIEDVAILNGGLRAWKKEGREISSEPVSRRAKQLTITLQPKLIATRDQVFSAISDNGVRLIDALPEAHFRGDFSLFSRAGHIPSSINMPSMNQIDGSYYRSYDELNLMFDDERSKPSITYCGGGIAAASLAFNMHRLGFNNVAVYMGSLQEWITDSSNPMAVEVRHGEIHY